MKCIYGEGAATACQVVVSTLAVVAASSFLFIACKYCLLYAYCCCIGKTGMLVVSYVPASK